VDEQHGPSVDPEAMGHCLEPGLGLPVVEPTWADGPASVVARVSAEPGGGGVVVEGTVSCHSPGGQASPGRNLVWRRGGGAVGCSCGDDLGAAGSDANRVEYRGTIWPQPGFGGERTRSFPVHGRPGTSQREGVHRVFEAVVGEGRTSDLLDRRRAPDAQGEKSPGVCGSELEASAAVFFAALLAGIESG